MVLPTTEIAEKYEIPYIVPNAIAGAITSRGLKYVFKPRVSVETETKATVDYSIARWRKDGCRRDREHHDRRRGPQGLDKLDQGIRPSTA